MSFLKNNSFAWTINYIPLLNQCYTSINLKEQPLQYNINHGNRFSSSLIELTTVYNPIL